jgi:hypothetical protein
MIEKDLIEIYKDNMFLLKAENKDLWFSVMSPLDSDYYKRTFAILTAWNPNNKPTTDTENSTANTKLKADLSKYEVLDSIGKYNDHEEESFLVYDISIDNAFILSVKYNQYSVFYNDTNKLSYYECSSKRILVEKYF